MIFRANCRVFIKPGYTDLRKSLNGLTLIVQEIMHEDPFSECYFIFCNRKKNILKIVYWDKNGFCLWLKRLEQERFGWPKTEADKRELKRSEFEWLLKGLDFQKEHKELQYSQL